MSGGQWTRADVKSSESGPWSPPQTAGSRTTASLPIGTEIRCAGWRGPFVNSFGEGTDTWSLASRMPAWPGSLRCSLLLDGGCSGGTGSAAATTANLITTTITTEARASATPSQTTGTVASDTVWVVVSYRYGRFRSCPEVIQCR